MAEKWWKFPKSNLDWGIAAVVGVIGYQLSVWLVGIETAIGYAVYVILMLTIERHQREAK